MPRNANHWSNRLFKEILAKDVGPSIEAMARFSLFVAVIPPGPADRHDPVNEEETK
jgi:hypothetical protein